MDCAKDSQATEVEGIVDLDTIKLEGHKINNQSNETMKVNPDLSITSTA